MKKVISLVLALLMFVTMFPLSAFAENGDGYTTETQQEISYNASNTLGEVLADAMNESESEAEKDNFCFIQSVEIEGRDATIVLSAEDASTVVVAVYDEETNVMVTSGKAEVDSETETVTVELAECEMPEYFVVKVFLLNSENEPLCKSYESLHYTEDFVEFFAKTVFDFDEEKVINLDYGYDSNFAVVSDDAKVTEQTAEENILASNDYDNGIYVFENANEEITSLKEGDVLYFVYGNNEEDYVLTKIGSINNDNGTVTITAAEDFELSDFFSYIKIDTEEIQREQPQTFSLKNGFDDEQGNVNDFSPTFSIDVSVDTKKDNKDNFYAKFSGKFSAVFYLKFYYDINIGEDYYEITKKTTFSFEGEAALNAVSKKDFEPLVVFHGGIPIFLGLEAEVLYCLHVAVEAKIEVSGSVEISSVDGARQISGRQKESLSQKPTIKLNCEISGKVSFSITPEISAGVKILHLISINISLEPSFEISGTIFSLEAQSGGSLDYPKEKHNCHLCVDGTISINLDINIVFKFGLNLKKQVVVLKITLIQVGADVYDFYISLKSNNSGQITDIEFGKGKCPEIEYRVTFNVMDNSKKPLNNAEIKIGSRFIATNSKGKAYLYLKSGTYDCVPVLKNYYIDHTKISTKDYIRFAVADSEATVNIYLTTKKNTDQDEIKNTSGIKASGNCGTQAQWTLYKDGELIITGSGAVTSPFHSYSNKNSAYIKKVSISNGITSICEGCFWGCSIEKVTLPESLISIGLAAFENCKKIKNYSVNKNNKYFCNDDYGVLFNKDKTKLILYPVGNSRSEYNIPNSVKTIGEYAFCYNKNIKKISFPSDVTKIESGAFGYCINISNIKLPANLTTLGEHVFSGCSKLEEISIPEKVTKIGVCVFFGCENLKLITLGKNINAIEKAAFYGCTKLATVYYAGSSSQWKKINIGDYNESLKKAKINYNVSLASLTQTLYLSKADDFSLQSFNTEDCLLGGVVPGYYYLIVVVKDIDLYDVLYSDNIIYIGQQLAATEQILFKIPINDSEQDYHVLFFGKNIGDKHVHNLNQTVFSPTCITNGYSLFECDCGYSYEDNIVEIVDHVTIDIASKSATCTETGLTEGKKCSVCGEILVAQEEISATGHTELIIAGKDSTCTEAGLTEGKKCSVCGEILVAQEEIPALGHKEEVISRKSATCTETGLTEGKKCSVCGEILVAQSEISALGHKEEIISGKSATCTETGLTEGKKCSVCNEILVAQSEIPALDHNYVAVVTAPSCIDKGYTTYTCSCGDSYVDNYVEATGHTEEAIAGKAAICTETGLTEGKKCSVCGEVLVAQKEIPATGHTPGSWEVVVEAQVGEDGLEQQKCTVCGEVVDERTIPALPDVSYMTGDANGDGKITAADARIALRISAKVDSLEKYNLTAEVLDVTGDGKLTAADARKILRIAAKIE